MTDTPNEDRSGFMAEEPEHCRACFRLSRPGQTQYLTIEHEVLCADCALDAYVIRVRHNSAVEVAQDRQRGPDAALADAQARRLPFALAVALQLRPVTRRQAHKSPHHSRTVVTAG